MSRNNFLQERLSVKFRKLLSGDPKGVPPWLNAVAEGDEAGYFLPSDAPWIVHADFATLVGGIRALLMQALHPGSLAGVKDHSRYKQDPLGRLSGTIRWLTVTTFGSKAAAAREAARVNGMHRKVMGEFQNASGKQEEYRASDKELLLWVHIAFMESFLAAHLLYSDKEIPPGEFSSGADNYISQWGISVEPLGLSDVPRNQADLVERIGDFQKRQKLVVSKDTLQVVSFIKKPPLPLVARIVYALLFEAAVVSLNSDFATMLGLKAKPTWLIIPLTRLTLRLMRIAVGPESPIEDAAKKRLERIGALG